MARRGTRITFHAARAILAATAVLGAITATATAGTGSVTVAPTGTRVTAAVSVADQAAEPVVLVHGWRGSPDTFAPMADRLRADGHPVRALTLPGEDNYRNAEVVAAAVEDLRAAYGNAPVAVVGHSMGGLSIRQYLQNLGGAGAIDNYVSLGTAHDGYAPVCGLPVELAGQMCPTSPFMTGLRQGDPTPGSARYVTLTSSLDDSRDQRLDGAACHREIAGVPHADEPGDPAFVDAVVTALSGTCP